MRVRFWGVRGSLPASMTNEKLREKLKRVIEVAVEKQIGPDTNVDAFIERELDFWVKGTFGTNTSCIEIEGGGDSFVLCDAGTGLRDFGNNFIDKHGSASGHKFHIFLSHPHWDHIQGFPFFMPAYMKGARITIYGGHQDLAKAFSTQQKEPFFPVDFSVLEADIDFVHLESGKSYEIAGMRVTVAEQNHPGASYGYRFEKDGKAVVYSTDSEPKYQNKEDLPLVDFFRNADLLIFDSQVLFVEACTFKENWGHSSNVIGVELAKASNVKHLCMFHLEPTLGDEELEKYLEDTRWYANVAEGGALQVSMAYDGMVIEV
ncbi:MAG TPA: MBL fold metallo-hydrolase [archaeon]|nr:MBL fold metallo-hydrolase [archaeon]